MDGILNKIINLDNQAKNKIMQIKQKEELCFDKMNYFY